MKTELHYYDIFPKVFPAGKEVKITVKRSALTPSLRNPKSFHLRFTGLMTARRAIIPTEKTEPKFLLSLTAV